MNEIKKDTKMKKNKKSGGHRQSKKKMGVGQSRRSKEPPPTATLDDADEGGEQQVLMTPSLASLLLSHHKKVSLLRRILSFHKTKNPKDYINLRSSSKLFRSVLRPPPLWTSFPCSNYATLQSLVDRLEELQGDEESSGNVPSVLFIEEGEFGQIPLRSYYITVKIPLSMYGAGCGKTTLFGDGLRIKGNKSDGIVEIGDLTIKGGKQHGLFADEGMNVIMRGCLIEDFQIGVFALGADITCDDVQVVGCGYSGVVAYNNATIMLSGQGTSIQRNVTKGQSSSYGLRAYSPSSKIHIIHPLTKEEISTNNGGGGNWGGEGTIEQVYNK